MRQTGIDLKRILRIVDEAFTFAEHELVRIRKDTVRYVIDRMNNPTHATHIVRPVRTRKERACTPLPLETK